MKKAILFLMLAISYCNTIAQTNEASLVEINFAGGSYPQEVTKGNNRIYFSANDYIFGRELWVRILSSNATFMVKNINPTQDGLDKNALLTMVGNVLYFKANDGTQVYPSLWRSNGTEDGTYQVKVIRPDFQDSNINNMTEFNGQLYFTANDGVNGNELWKSDGTAEGTVMVKDINPGAAGTNFSSFFVFNGSLYFVTSGSNLWKSDGTDSGTSVFSNISSILSSNQEEVVFGKKVIVMGGNFYFIKTTAGGNELWKSSGTAAGTQLVKDQLPLNATGYPVEGGIGNNYVVFMVGPWDARELWKSNGTQVGTVLLKHLNTSQVGDFRRFVSLNGQVYFTAYKNGSGFSQLWKTDGNVSGTNMVVDIDPANTGMKSIKELTSSGSFLIFSSIGYNTPYVSDGTPSGTLELSNLELSVTSQGESHFTPINGKVFFEASSGDLNGTELWETNGTAAGTSMLKDIHHRYSGLPAQESKQAASLNGKMIFVGNNGVNLTEPYISDGTLGGTQMIKDINQDYGSVGALDSYSVPIFTKVGGNLFFKARDNAHGYEIFKTDGTAANTVMVKDIAPGMNDAIETYTYFMEYNGIFYFKADDQVHGSELWRTDGTESGTYMVKDIYPGVSSGVIATNCYTITFKGYAVLNGFLYFQATDSTGAAIWRTDGTEAGTVKVLAFANNSGSIVGANSSRLFIAVNLDNSTYGPASLVSSDGTQAGSIVLGSYSYSDTTHFRNSCLFNDVFYYGVYNVNGGRTLMKSDGTISGTLPVKGNLPYNFEYLDSCGSYVYFGMGNITGSGYVSELWLTDGTPAGTIKVAGNTAASFSAFRSFTCVNSDMFHLRESGNKYLYVTKGDQEHTTYKIGMNVINGDAFVSDFGLNGILGIVGNTIYFSATTRSSGSELYIANIATLGLDDPDNVLQSPNEAVVLYPNPTKGALNFMSNCSQPVDSIEIYDLLGKRICQRRENAFTGTINMAGMQKGIYLVRIHQGTETITKKVIMD